MMMSLLLAVAVANPLMFPSYDQEVSAEFENEAAAAAAQAAIAPLPGDATMSFSCRWDDTNARHLSKGEMMNRAGVKGNFYLTGKEWNTPFMRDGVRKLVKAGHAFGNHTVSHPFMLTFSPNAAFRQVVEQRIGLEKHLQRTVTSYVSPFGWQQNPLDPDQAPTLAQAIVASGHFVTQDNPQPWSRMDARTWMWTYRFSADDHNPDREKFVRGFTRMLAAAKDDPLAPRVTLGTHSWCDAEGEARQEAWLKEFFHPEGAVQLNDWEYGAYRYQYLNGGVEKRGVRGRTATFRVRRFAAAYVGDDIALSLKFTAAPVKVSAAGATLARSDRGTWELPQAAGCGLPAEIAETHDGIGFEVAVDEAAGKLTVKLVNKTGSALESPYVAVALPPKWAKRRVSAEMKALANGGTATQELALGEIGHADYAYGKACYPVALDFTLGGRPIRLWKLVETPDMRLPANAPAAAVLQWGPGDPAALTDAMLAPASRPGAALPQAGEWKPLSAGRAWNLLASPIRLPLKTPGSARFFAYDFLAAGDGAMTVSTDLKAGQANAALFVNGEQMRFAGPGMKVPVRKGANRLILRADVAGSGYSPVLHFALEAFAPATAKPAGDAADLARFVDPFTGTAGTGHTHPSACAPFGMVQAGPDTGFGNWAYCPGYQFRDTSVLGYSLTHLSGTGCPDYNDVQILPFTGEVRPLPMRSAIDKRSEEATPGYYRVVQDEDGVEVEVSATERAAIYRFTWARAGQARVLLNLPFGQAVRKTWDADVKTADGCRIAGSYMRNGWIRDRRIAFAFAFDRKWTSLETLPKKHDGEPPRYVATFDVAAGGQTLVKVGLSMTDAEGAARNLAAEIPGWDFDGVRRATRAKWNGLFARSTCEGTDDQKANWYTALYHLYVQPNDYADADGRFSAADGSVGRSPDGTYFTTLSLWDTFRAAQPWYTIATPEVVLPVINSFLSHYRTFGRLPVMSYGGKNVDCMVGNHSIPVVADAYAKGFRDFDHALMFEAITNTLRVAHPGKPKENWDVYEKYGCFPCDIIRGESVSRCLECSYDDWCAAQYLKATGHGAEAAFFLKRAQNWKNVFDSSIGFGRGKTSDGKWREPFDPFAFGHGAENNNDFTEGNAFQYSWHVMQDVPGLVAAMGGREKFIGRLDSLFTAPAAGPDTQGNTVLLDISGMIGQYVHGNEPSHHVIYFYPQVGCPDKAAERIREVFDTQYHVGPEGLCGNDDCGQMSAWYVFSAMGFYPFNPCGGEYIIGAPQVEKVTLRCSPSPSIFTSFTVIAKNLSKENKYVKSVTLNGKPVTDWKIRHADILAGGELVFEMGR